jgi:hypothetical protein
MAKEGYLQRDEGLQPEDGTEDGSVVVEAASKCVPLQNRKEGDQEE